MTGSAKNTSTKTTISIAQPHVHASQQSISIPPCVVCASDEKLSSAPSTASVYCRSCDGYLCRAHDASEHVTALTPSYSEEARCSEEPRCSEGARSFFLSLFIMREAYEFN